jgi:hypothetical protein
VSKYQQKDRKKIGERERERKEERKKERKKERERDEKGASNMPNKRKLLTVVHTRRNLGLIFEIFKISMVVLRSTIMANTDVALGLRKRT